MYAPSHSGMQSGDDHLLATKWLKPKELAALVETDGLNVKKGKFSTGEKNLVEGAVQRYQEVRPLYWVFAMLKHTFVHSGRELPVSI
jgi:hypothetical protein